MRNFLFLALAITFASCNQQTRYTQNSAEIDTYKKSIAAYEKQDWEALATFYADTAKILNNVTPKHAQTVAQNIAMNKQDSALFTKWAFVDKENEYEMILTDKGETWVNFWGLWQGTLKADGKVYEIPCSITARFIDGKIVREYGYWDNSKLLKAIAETGPGIVTDSTKSK